MSNLYKPLKTMKKFIFPTLMTFAALLMLSLSSCSKEDNIRPIEEYVIPTTIDLNGTSWEGDREATYMGYPIGLDWIFDFTSETEVEVQVSLALAGQTASRSTTGTYIFNGTEGTLTFWNKTFEMRYNNVDTTLVVPDLTMSLSDGTTITDVGGETVFHQR